jgi:hypothetical protein
MRSFAIDHSLLPTAALRPLLDAVAQQAELPAWDAFAPGEWLEALILEGSLDGASGGTAERLDTLRRRIGELVAPDGHVSIRSAHLCATLGGLAFGLRTLRRQLPDDAADVPCLLRHITPTRSIPQSAAAADRAPAYIERVRAWAWVAQRDRAHRASEGE